MAVLNPLDLQCLCGFVGLKFCAPSAAPADAQRALIAVHGWTAIAESLWLAPALCNGNGGSVDAAVLIPPQEESQVQFAPLT